MMLGLLLYVYGVVGLYMFRDDDPQHWGTLGAALLTLFQMLTLEGWVEIQAAVLTQHPWAWVYFASFVFVAVFVVVNLFIAVVINNLETVKIEHQADETSQNPQRGLLVAIEDLQQRLAHMERLLRDAPAPSGRERRAP